MKKPNTTKKEHSKVLDSLEGSVTDVEEELEESEEPEEKEGEEAAFDPSAPMLKNRRFFFAVGVITIALAIVGLVTTVRFCISLIGDIANQTALKNEFAVFLYPMVITDGPAFDSVADAPDSVVINAAIWRIIMNGDTEKYENDGTNMTVSQIDVESSVTALFGYGANVEHQTVGVGSNVFEYNAASKSYFVPLDPNYNTYWPRVSEISSVGELFTVTVEYMPPSMFATEGMDYQLEPDKVMVYTVSRTASSMTINSLRYYQETAE
ncbi:MAG: hypothetical protein J1F60_08210 [Oscillospiraceae bacterium]|nr:hypothetical protein [Oscillospiraceae bacterium]